uniref:Scaffolding anchor of CK1 domain-containing protein n=1 Tax=Amphilophus citrinellus TaxID=61819 RepID=A0A3Q0RTV2_AMPCI
MRLQIQFYTLPINLPVRLNRSKKKTVRRRAASQIKNAWHYNPSHASHTERGAVEKLLSEGPEAFYSSLIKERSGCFLSSEEVSQLPRWVQNYHFNEPQVQQENGVESISEMEDFCSSYFPCHSDLPVPDLELGWPEKFPLVEIPSVTVHIIFMDKHNSSFHMSRDEVLNTSKRKLYFLLTYLVNIRVRVIGGRSFGLRDGRKVVGEMKEKFLLLDLETVIHGSYSFTWTDARLHRQLITVLKGPVVDSFDREFRTLYGNSFPVPTAVSHVNCYHHQKDISAHRLQKKTSVGPEITDPPSPTADSPVDWEVLGFFPEDTSLPASPLYCWGSSCHALSISAPLTSFTPQVFIPPLQAIKVSHLSPLLCVLLFPSLQPQLVLAELCPSLRQQGALLFTK